MCVCVFCPPGASPALWLQGPQASPCCSPLPGPGADTAPPLLPPGHRASLPRFQRPVYMLANCPFSQPPQTSQFDCNLYFLSSPHLETSSPPVKAWPLPSGGTFPSLSQLEESGSSSHFPLRFILSGTGDWGLTERRQMQTLSVLFSLGVKTLHQSSLVGWRVRKCCPGQQSPTQPRLCARKAHLGGPGATFPGREGPERSRDALAPPPAPCAGRVLVPHSGKFPGAGISSAHPRNIAFLPQEAQEARLFLAGVPRPSLGAPDVPLAHLAWVLWNPGPRQPAPRCPGPGLEAAFV